jgi:hypothetical protein
MSIRGKGVTGEWREVHTEEFCRFYLSNVLLCRSNKGSMLGVPEGKRPFGRPRRISKDNIKTDFK